MKVSRMALAAMLAVGGPGVTLATPAVAQQYGQPQQQQQVPQQERRRGRQQRQQEAPAGPQLTPEEAAVIIPVSTAVQAQDWAAAAAALPAAQAGATTPYGKFVVGQLQLSIGRGTNNEAMQAEAVNAMVASGGAPATALPAVLGAQASFAIRGENWTLAEQALNRVLELDANNAERIRQLAEVKIRLNKNPEALTLYQRLIQLGEANGQNAPEDHYRRAHALAVDTGQTEAATQLVGKLLRAYPTPENWRTSLVGYRQAASEDPAMALDIRRLMRSVQAFTRAADYLEFADRLNRVGLPGEVQAVIQEGINRGHVQANDATARQMLSTAIERAGEDRRGLAATRTRALAAATGREARIAGDLYFGNGQYAEAAELFRAALQKGGEDANLVNTRLGAALALAGRRAEAETALRAVTGPRAQLANYWLLWLAGRPAA